MAHPTFNTQNGTLTVGNINGANALTLNAGTGQVVLQGQIGNGGSASSPTTTTVTGTTTIVEQSNVFVNGSLTFNGTMTLSNGSGSVSMSSGGNGIINFNGTIDGAQNLILNSGSTGDITFNGNVGGITPISVITKLPKRSKCL